MIRHLIAFLLLIAATGAEAQTIPVRSGEHGAFTRLAFDLPGRMEWQVVHGQEPRHADILLDGSDYPLDLSRVFDRIDRKRISTVNALPGNGGLRIEFGCDCAATAFLAAGNMLVVDIRPGEIPNPVPVANDPPPPVVASPESLALSGIRVGSMPGIGPTSRGNDLLPSVFSPGGPATAPPETRTETEEFEQKLAEEIASAATRGLLHPALRPLPEPETVQQDNAHGDQHPSEQPATTDMGHVARKIVETLVDPHDPHDPEDRIRIGGTECIPATSLDIASWAGDDGLETTIPELKARLFGEFDRIERPVLYDLARAYLRFGFGAEARALLNMDPGTPDPMLMALAGLTDGAPDRAGVFAGQTGCDGPAALWALLGSEHLPDVSQVNDVAILRSFEELPLTLRTLVGPKLASRLAEEGKPNAARNVLSRLARATGENSEDMVFSAAKIDRIEGAVAQARSVLNEIAQGSGPNAAEAVAAAIEIAADHDEPISADMVDLSAAYSVEFRQTDQGPELWLAHERALIGNGQIAEAFAELDDTDAHVPEATRAQAETELLHAVLTRAPDASFLRYTVARRPHWADEFPESVVLPLAERLLSLGLPDAAETWLGRSDGSPGARDARLLQARIDLARSHPEAAEIALIGLQGEDVIALRAEARRMMGDYDFAANAFETLGDENRARSAAWLAGDWSTVERGPPDPLAAAAALVQTTQPELPGTTPTLALAQSLASSSAEARQTLQDLLDQTRIPQN